LEAYATDAQTHAEEIINTITHGMGLILSIPATIILVHLAKIHGNKWHVSGCAVFGFSLILVYTCSTLYHASGISVLTRESQEFFRTLDHCAIYFLIAGTYTPLTLINVVHNNIHPNKSITKLDKRLAVVGCVILVIVWLICFVGSATKLILGSDNVNPVASYASYLIMGWLVLVVAKPFFNTLPRTGFRLLIAGKYYKIASVLSPNICY